MLTPQQQDECHDIGNALGQALNAQGLQRLVSADKKGHGSVSVKCLMQHSRCTLRLNHCQRKSKAQCVVPRSTKWAAPELVRNGMATVTMLVQTSPCNARCACTRKTAMLHSHVDPPFPPTNAYPQMHEQSRQKGFGRARCQQACQRMCQSNGK